MSPDSPHELRASDADREAAVGRLRVAAMEGRLDAEELADRVSKAYDSRWCGELERLTADVTPAPGTSVTGPPVFVRPSQSVNGFAIASLVAGFIWFMWVGSVVAVVFGHLALRQIARSGGHQSGKGLAIGGLVLGYLGMLSLLVALLYSIG